MMTMKKTVIVICSTLLFVAGCGGNKLDLDEEKVRNVVAERALQQKVIKEGNYKKSDIEIVKVCEAINKRKKEFGFQGDYIVYWQTKDGKYQRDFMMNDYKIEYGTNNYEEVQDRCINFD
jgi:uncharacterized protein YcfL